MRNIAIITARSGSKGLKDKNIKPLNGMPLMAYSIKAAKESGLFDEIMVSTDSQEYAEIAKQYGANVPFLRSEAMSSDKASSWDTVREVIDNYKKENMFFDNVFLLQPTSPLRTAEDLIGAYKLFNDKKADYVVSVCEVDHSPLWCNEIPEDLSMRDFINKKWMDKPRQALPQFYRLNGAVYIMNIDYLFSKMDNTFLNGNSFAYIMPKNRSIDVDDIIDFATAEAILNINK